MNNNRDVYLAGPITGFNYIDCTDWRDHVRLQLSLAGLRGLSPMRGKEYLRKIAENVPFTADGDKYAVQGPLSTNRGIITRDRFDSTRCAVLFVNLLGAKQVSIGTCIEIGWADANRTPIVCVMEKGNPHEHGMIMEAIGYRVESLGEAIDITKAILI